MDSYMRSTLFGRQTTQVQVQARPNLGSTACHRARTKKAKFSPKQPHASARSLARRTRGRSGRGAGRSRGSRAHHKGEAGALQGDVDIHWPVRDISMRDRHREKAKLLDDVYGQNRAEDKVGFVRIQPIPVRRQRVVGLAHRRSPATKPMQRLGLQLLPHLHPNWNPRGVEGTGRRSHFQRYNSCAIEATNISDFRLNSPLRTDTKRESEVMPCYVICLNDLKCHCINLSL